MQLILACAALGLSIIINVVGVVWFISNRLRDLSAMFTAVMNAHQISDNAQFGLIRSEISDMGETLRKEFGETGHAFREKIREIELFSRDTFVRKDEIRDDLSEIKALIERMR